VNADGVCVFITAGPSTKLFARGGSGIVEDMCYERRRAEACVDYGTREEPGTLTQGAPVFPGSSHLGMWESNPKLQGVCVWLLLQDLVQSCVRGEGGDIGGHVLRETLSRGLCGLVCPSRTSERGGEGDCVKEGGGGEGKCERERALERLRCYSPGY
jgi:hypothetical protein